MESFGFYISNALSIVNNVDMYFHVIEGDLSNEKISYFEGVKSVGELENNELILSSKNKNIFNGVLKKGFYDIYGGYHYDNNAICNENFISIKPNTDYVISIEGYKKDAQIFISQYDYYNNHINQLTTKNGKFRTDKEARYIRINTHASFSDNLTLNSKIQIEKGENLNDYVSNINIENKTGLNEPLRGLPNGVKDRIVKRNGQWVIERNINSINLKNATEILGGAWHHEVLEDKFGLHDMTNGTLSVAYNSSQYAICNKYTTFSRYGTYSGEFAITPGYMRFHNDFGFTNVNEWLNYINTEDIIIIYQLETPIYEPLNTDLSLNLFKEITYISNNSTIPVNMKVTIDRAINRAVEAIELAKENPTLENLARARMWSNLLKESIKKDELNNEINNITNIKDLQLERKMTTSNVDIYIKSENMLLMSLSTNSITFNDYSGVEDIELNNVINISINSSLPYQLNSYLLTEIENNDKSNRIEKDLLNIKSSSDTDYKIFDDINEKLILEDDCIAGNNKSHSIDLKLKGSQAHKADIYKTVIKFEAEQK